MLLYWLELARDVGLDVVWTVFLGLVVGVSVNVTGSTIPTYLTKPYISSFDHKVLNTMLLLCFRSLTMAVP